MQSWESVLTSQTTPAPGAVPVGNVQFAALPPQRVAPPRGDAGTQRRTQTAGSRIAVVELGIELAGDIHRRAAADDQVKAHRWRSVSPCSVVRGSRHDDGRVEGIEGAAAVGGGGLRAVDSGIGAIDEPRLGEMLPERVGLAEVGAVVQAAVVVTAAGDGRRRWPSPAAVLLPSLPAPCGSGR